jgi:threonine synthase
MQYFSTNKTSPAVGFRDALRLGQAPDGGLYFPSEIPTLSGDLVSNLADRSNADIAYEMIRPFVEGEIPDEELHGICVETVDFPFPLIRITDRISALELFHGPTLAFKDVGARFMSRCIRYFSDHDDRKTLVIVATSGDTGGAVAAGFHGIENIEVVILYPKGRVSRVQELQLTTLGGNVTTLEVRGNFDDCQKMAKQALADPDIRSNANLTSANSINVARWLSQQFYYAFGLKQWDHTEAPILSVPSGNFGNIAAGLLAHASGLPVSGFIAACNSNDVVPRYFETGAFKPIDSIPTLSNAMDVGNPSNFSRMIEIFRADAHSLEKLVTAVSVTDDDTVETMKRVYAESGYVLDPHGAVGYKALENHLADHPGKRGIFLATAHPVKFECVKEIVGNYGVVPQAIQDLLGKTKVAKEVAADYDEVRNVLLSLL